MNGCYLFILEAVSILEKPNIRLQTRNVFKFSSLLTAKKHSFRKLSTPPGQKMPSAHTLVKKPKSASEKIKTLFVILIPKFPISTSVVDLNILAYHSTLTN